MRRLLPLGDAVVAPCVGRVVVLRVFLELEGGMATFTGDAFDKEGDEFDNPLKSPAPAAEELEQVPMDAPTTHRIALIRHDTYLS